MPTYFIDFEGGNDANAGTSFATRWRTITSGATAARIAPGDDIRIMASPDPVDMGVNGTWTQMDMTASSRPTIAISTASNTTPIRITTSLAHGLLTNDTVFINNVNTNIRANGTWRVTVINSTQFDLYNADGTASTPTAAGTGGTFSKITGYCVTLATPVTQNIALCGNRGTKGNWVASTNVTQSENTTDFQEGSSSQSIVILAAFSTGKAAYFTLPSALNLSSFQQVCFWIYQTSGARGSAGQTYIALCSDTLGDVVVHQVSVPALAATFVWVPVVVNFGAALSTSIQSVAFYVTTDVGAQTFSIDNIFAAGAAGTATSLNLTSLISKNTTGESWYVCKSINANRVVLNGSNGLSLATTSGSSAMRGYNGTTATQTLFRRETVPVLGAELVAQLSGSAGSFITYSGGWDRTSMATQTGYTWIDGRDSFQNGFTTNNRSYLRVQRLNPVRCNNGYTLLGTPTLATPVYSQVSDFSAVGNVVGVSFGGSNTTLSNFTINSCAGTSGTGAGINFVSTNMIGSSINSGTITNSGIGMNTTTSGGNYFGRDLACADLTFSNCSTAGYLADESTYTNIQVINCTSTFSIGTNTRVYGGSATGASTFPIASPLTYNSSAYFYNFTNSTGGTFFGGLTTGSFPVVYSNRQGNTDNNHFIYTINGTINFQTAVTDPPAIGSWRFAPTSADAALYPVALKLGTVVCNGGSLVTVTARMRRDNTGLTMQLVCPGGQQPGVATTVVSSMTAAANTWETVSISFTPTSAGGLDIYVYAFGGTTNLGYVCNMTATQ